MPIELNEATATKDPEYFNENNTLVIRQDLTKETVHTRNELEKSKADKLDQIQQLNDEIKDIDILLAKCDQLRINSIY